MSLNLADQSVRQPQRIVEDVLIQGGKLIIAANFEILDMEEEPDDKDLLSFWLAHSWPS